MYIWSPQQKKLSMKNSVLLKNGDYDKEIILGDLNVNRDNKYDNKKP